MLSHWKSKLWKEMLVYEMHCITVHRNITWWKTENQCLLYACCLAWCRETERRKHYLCSVLGKTQHLAGEQTSLSGMAAVSRNEHANEKSQEVIWNLQIDDRNRQFYIHFFYQLFFFFGVHIQSNLPNFTLLTLTMGENCQLTKTDFLQLCVWIVSLLAAQDKSFTVLANPRMCKC